MDILVETESMSEDLNAATLEAPKYTTMLNDAIESMESWKP